MSLSNKKANMLQKMKKDDLLRHMYICFEKTVLLALMPLQWISVYILVQQIPCTALPQGCIPGKRDEQHHDALQNVIRKGQLLKVHCQGTYHCGTNGAIQIASPA